MYCLDTNACIQLLNGTNEAIVAQFCNQKPTDIALCSIVKAELLYGARNSTRVSENLSLLKRFFTPLQSFSFDSLAAEHYGLIRADLAARGALIGVHDMMIAAIARAQDMTVVTHNLGEFQRVIGLRVVDWQAG